MINWIKLCLKGKIKVFEIMMETSYNNERLMRILILTQFLYQQQLKPNILLQTSNKLIIFQLKITNSKQTQPLKQFFKIHKKAQMFTQKYHKQLLSLLPLVQQQGQQQSVQPSNKYNSNDEEQCQEQCFTPNYNVVEDQVQGEGKKGGEYGEKDDEENKGEEEESRYRSSENYRLMRENGLDYQKWMARGFDLGDNLQQKSLVIRDQKILGSGEYESIGHHQGDRSMGNQQGDRSVGYEKGHKLSPSLSSFQNLIDSGMNINTNNAHATIINSTVLNQPQPQPKPPQPQATTQPQPPLNSPNPSPITYQHLNLPNNSKLTSQTLKTNPNLRLQLIKQLINLMNLGHDTQQINNACCLKLTQVSQFQDIVSFSVIPVKCSSYGIGLEQGNKDRGEFQTLEKVVEGKWVQIADTRIGEVKEERRIRQRKQLLASSGYGQLTRKQYEKYQEKAFKSLSELESKVNMQLNHYQTKICQQFRSQTYQQNLPFQHVSQSLQNLSSLIHNLKSQHESSIDSLMTFYSTDFKQLQLQVKVLQQKIASMEFQVQQKIESIEQLVSKMQLYQQPDQSQISMIQLIKELQRKVDLSYY